MSDIVTYISIGIIIAVFLYFTMEEYKLFKLNETVKKLRNNDNILVSLKETNIAPLADTYSKTINIDTSKGKKSNIPASEFINDFSVCKYNKLNLRMLDTAAGTLVGLGLLGTFLGLTLGIKGFDSSNTERINESIQGLLAGMGTAFLTSLLGMTFSILFTVADKALRHRLYKDVKELTDKLDSEYYIDDLVLANINQQNIVNQLYKALKNDLQQQTLEIANKLTYTNTEGQNVTIGNAIREILTENTKQSKALMSFSTDLAMELNQGFDETLSRQMQQKIVPLWKVLTPPPRLLLNTSIRWRTQFHLLLPT